MTDRNRKTAYSVLWDVERNGAYSNLALNAHIGREKPDSPAFVRELVYGVLENEYLLDWEIGPFLKQPVEKLGLAEKLLLRLGFWQILFSDSIPAYAAVNGTVDLAKDVAKGREGFVNAVLRNYLRGREALPEEGTETAGSGETFFGVKVIPPVPRLLRPLPDRAADPVRWLSLRYSCHEWIVTRWLADYDEELVEMMLATSLETPPVAIRPNASVVSKETLKAVLAIEKPSLNLRMSSIADNAFVVSGGSVTDTKAYAEGLFSIQEEPSIRCVEVLDPKPGVTVYDVCAAPGGKTLAIWEMMRCEGTLVACDVNGAKLGRIRKEAKRLGLKTPRLVVRNAATGRAPESALSAASAELFLLPESADRVLVDAPCSALGTIARKPELKLRGPDPEIEGLPAKQLAILAESAKLVRPGGRLVYSTCTVGTAENGNVVRAFLNGAPEWECADENQLIPVSGFGGADGFYIACLVRKGTL